MGLVFETSKWLDRLWVEHLDASIPARDLIRAGVDKQGDAFAGFAADVHARLYLPTDPARLDRAPSWAVSLHNEASQLAEWQRLRTMCARNGFAAGVAAETVLEHLLPHVPDKTTSGPSQDSDVRTSLRRAARCARNAIEEAESSAEGLTTALGVSPRDVAAGNLTRIREAHAALARSPRLRRIASIAGRMQRSTTSKARSRVRPGVGEIHGITQSGDLARVLPSELACLRHPVLRRVVLARLVEHQALAYAMTGREPLARGPIIVLLDESSSMRGDERDVWSKAVALTLLATASRQRRAWHLVAFNAAITREVAITTPTLDDITRALDHACSGGTNFNPPVQRAIDIIRASRTMTKADVIILTDGESTLDDTTAHDASTLTRSEGVSWFVIAVGPDAASSAANLAPIATCTTILSRPSPDTPVMLDVA